MSVLRHRSPRLLGALATIVVVIGPLWYAVSGGRTLMLGLSATLAYGVVLGLIVGLGKGFDAGLTMGFVGALAVGLATGFIGVFAPERLSSPGQLFRPIELFAVILAMNLAERLVPEAGRRYGGATWTRVVVQGARNGALIGLLFEVLHVLIMGVGARENVLERTLYWGAVGGLAGAITAPVGLQLARWLRPRLQVFVDLLPYLREIWVPLGGFTLGYLALAFLFATFYGAAWRADPQGAFRGLPANPSFGNFFYFSQVTISTLGSSVIAPGSQLVRGLVLVEVILGIGWTTVFLATLLAYLQPRFQLLNAELEKKRRSRAD